MSTGTGSWVGGDDWYAKVDASVTTNSAASAVITVKCICVSQYGTTSGYSNIQGATAYGSNSYNWGSATSISTNSTKTLKTSTYTITKTHAAQSIKCWAQVKGIAGVYSGSTSTATVNVTVSAKTSYAIKYNGNGGTLNAKTTAQTKWYGETLKLHGGTTSSPNPTRTGYSFLGWSTSSTATTATYAGGANYTANAAATLYAVWKANTYTVAYNANKPSAATGSVTGMPSNQTKTYGTTLKLSTAKPSLSLYNFLGWATSASATTATYQPGGNYTANAAATLYAVWELAYTVPSPPLSVTATNIYSDVVSNTKANITIELPDIPSGNMGHRTGYNVYIDNVLKQSYTDADQTAHTVPLEDFDIGDHAGKPIYISVACVGEAGASVQTSAATLYGKLVSPIVSSWDRGWSIGNSGYYATINVADSSENTYEHSLKLYVSDGVTTDEYNVGRGVTINGVTGNATWVNSALTVSVKAIAFDEAHTSEMSEARTIESASYAAQNVAVAQVMGSGDDAGVGYAGITFDGAIGEDSGTSYLITFDGYAPEHTLAYDSSGTYSYSDVVWMTQAELPITITAMRNGYAAQPQTLTFSYTPRTLKPPTISLASYSENEFVIQYTNAQYGEPKQEGQESGYGYQVLLGDVVYDAIDFVSIEEPTHEYTLVMNDPYYVNVSMKSVDNSDAVSLGSNIIRLHREVSGAGIYAYNASMDLERLVISNADICVVTNTSAVNVEHCVFSGNMAYSIENDSDVIIEHDNRYHIGE